jgi:hypothetical protein
MDVNWVLSMHDKFTKDEAAQLEEENQVALTTLVYYYLIEGQLNNLFQLLRKTKN